MSIFEVHFWSETGRILTIHIPAFGGPPDEPVLTELYVTGERGSADLSIVTHVMAKCLADGGEPSGSLVEHSIHGVYQWQKQAVS